MRILATLLCVAMLGLSAMAASPSFQNFNTNQFRAVASPAAVDVKGGSSQTNNTFRGDIEIRVTNNAAQVSPQIRIFTTATNDYTIHFMDQDTNSVGSIGVQTANRKLAITAWRQISLSPGILQMPGAIQAGSLLGGADGNYTNSDYFYFEKNGIATAPLPLRPSKRVYFNASRHNGTEALDDMGVLWADMTDTNGQMSLNIAVGARSAIDARGFWDGYPGLFLATNQFLMMPNTVSIGPSTGSLLLNISTANNTFRFGHNRNMSATFLDGSGVRYAEFGQFGNFFRKEGLAVATNTAAPPSDASNYGPGAVFFQNTNGTFNLFSTPAQSTSWGLTNPLWSASAAMIKTNIDSWSFATLHTITNYNAMQLRGFSGNLVTGSVTNTFREGFYECSARVNLIDSVQGRHTLGIFTNDVLAGFTTSTTSGANDDTVLVLLPQVFWLPINCEVKIKEITGTATARDITGAQLFVKTW